MPFTNNDPKSKKELLKEFVIISSGKKLCKKKLPLPKFDIKSVKLIYRKIYSEDYFLMPLLIEGNKQAVEFGDGTINSTFLTQAGLQDMKLPSKEVYSNLYKPNNSLHFSRENSLVFHKDDKISIGHYKSDTYKKYNALYQKKHCFNISLTLNNKSGCFYFTINQHDGTNQGKRSSSKNDFNSLIYKLRMFKEDSLKEFINYIKDEFDLTKYYDESKDIYETAKHIIIDWFFKINKIKTTDNYERNFLNFYPGLTILKKHNGNLTESICKKYKLRGKKVRRIINMNDDINVNVLKYLTSLFTIEIFNAIPEENIIRFCKENRGYGREEFKADQTKAYKEKQMFKIFELLNKTCREFLSIAELNKLVKILDPEFGKLSLNDINDHIDMKKEITNISGTNHCKITFRNKSEFTTEHYLFSQILTEIKKPSDRLIYYTPETITLIEEPIYYNGLYDIVILKSREDFIEEGLYQHHCVAKYAEYDSSVISIRKDSKRLTCEFSYYWQLSQQQHAYDSDIFGDWKMVAKALTERIRILASNRLIKPKALINIPKTKEEIEKVLNSHIELPENVDVTEDELLPF